MNGISPKLPTPTALQISSTVSQHVLQFPDVISTLVGHYAVCNVEMAAQPLIFDQSCHLVDCDENTQIKLAIREVLTEPECDIAIKRSIFQNIADCLKSGKDRHCLAALNAIFKGIRSDGQRIFLDRVDFSDLEFSGLDLSGSSMVAARFAGAKLSSIRLVNTDLTEAFFQKTKLTDINCADAIFARSIITNSRFDQCSLFRASFMSALYIDTLFTHVLATGIRTEDACLRSIVRRSEFDTREGYRTPEVTTLLDKFPPESPNSSTDPASGVMVVLYGRYNSSGVHSMNVNTHEEAFDGRSGSAETFIEYFRRPKFHELMRP